MFEKKNKKKTHLSASTIWSHLESNIFIHRTLITLIWHHSGQLYIQHVWVAAVFRTWKKIYKQKKKRPQNYLKVHELSLGMETRYAEIEIYKGVMFLPKIPFGKY